MPDETTLPVDSLVEVTIPVTLIPLGLIFSIDEPTDTTIQFESLQQNTLMGTLQILVQRIH
jgi:hypothetical protein